MYLLLSQRNIKFTSTLYSLLYDNFPLVMYNSFSSYEIDPTWQRKFSIIWASVAGAAILFSLPHLIRSIRRGYTLENLTGVWEDSSGRSYEPLLSDKFHENKKEIPGNQKRMLGWNRLKGLLSVLHSFTMWTAPHIGLDVGQSSFLQLV